MARARNYFLILLGIVILVDFTMNFLGGIFRGGFTFYNWQKPQLSEIDFKLFSNKIEKSYVSQGYGATYFAIFSYIHPWHNGIDIVAKTGANIHSPTDGIVAHIGDQDKYCYKRAYGKFVAIKNDNDAKTLLYAHLNKILVNKGDKVKTGDIIGLVGQSGQATAPHLHFSVFSAASFKLPVRNGCGPYPTGKDANPIPYLESLNSRNDKFPL